MQKILQGIFGFVFFPLSPEYFSENYASTVASFT